MEYFLYAVANTGTVQKNALIILWKKDYQVPGEEFKGSGKKANRLTDDVVLCVWKADAMKVLQLR